MSGPKVSRSGVTLSRRCAAPKCSRKVTGRAHRRTCSPACRKRLSRAERKPRPGFRGQPGTGSRTGDDWHTPGWLLEAARAALGGAVHLDPASSPEAQRRVRAEVWYGPGSPWAPDGLAVDPWPEGPVFCNPPYGRQPGGRTKLDWTRRLAAHWAGGRGPVVAVLPGDLSAGWAGPVRETAPAIAWATGRVRFLPGGDRTLARDPALGTMVALWGADHVALVRAGRGRLAAWGRMAGWTA